MTKSSARKAAAKKAHSTSRKPAPKAAPKKARGTYRKTAAQFEEFAHDAQLPESIRILAEKSVVQTRGLCEHSLEAVLQSWQRFVDAGQGAVALNLKRLSLKKHWRTRLRASRLVTSPAATMTRRG
jgi:formate dehydrogenase maturation protein FdhE